MKKQSIIGYENFKLVTYLWDNVKNPKGVVQIVHGMAEHAKRYNDFAKFLNTNGFIVYASDLRSHGESAESIESLGIADGNLFENIVEDQKIISEFLINKYNLPLYILGHSYGSFITQRYIQQCNLPTKVILVGTAYTKTLTIKMGKLVANISTLFKGKDAPATLIEKMSFGAYGKKFDNKNWLCRDEKIFEEYKKDPFCGTVFTCGFYKNAFKNFINNYKTLNNINKNTPILIVCGNQDPVGGNGKLANKLDKIYKKQGLKSNLFLYEGGRHEMLNEINKEEVYLDVLTFLNK